MPQTDLNVPPTHSTVPPPARVFVGLKMAPDIAGELAQLAAGLEKLSVRLIAPADIHLTLVPPWSETSIAEAIAKLRDVADRFGGFSLIIEHVGYGPDPRRPRLLWADCAASDEIVTLRDALFQTFGQTDERPFRPHVTLARIRGNGFSIARRHPIDRKLSRNQRIETIELFQSPPAGQSGYRVLASVPLAKMAHVTPNDDSARAP
jgi:2'-5' RNA ligase